MKFKLTTHAHPDSNIREKASTASPMFKQRHTTLTEPAYPLNHLPQNTFQRKFFRVKLPQHLATTTNTAAKGVAAVRPLGEALSQSITADPTPTKPQEKKKRSETFGWMTRLLALRIETVTTRYSVQARHPGGALNLSLLPCSHAGVALAAAAASVLSLFTSTRSPSHANCICIFLSKPSDRFRVRFHRVRSAASCDVFR